MCLTLGRHYLKKNMYYVINSLTHQVSFHFTFSVSHPVGEMSELNKIAEPLLSCKNPKEVLQQLLKVRDEKMLSWRKKFEYPQNLMRNLAKSGCPTNYTFIPGLSIVVLQIMKIVPSKKFEALCM